jgi:hypothetical protein
VLHSRCLGVNPVVSGLPRAPGCYNKKVAVETITIQLTFKCYHEVYWLPLALVVRAEVQMLEKIGDREVLLSSAPKFLPG